MRIVWNSWSQVSLRSNVQPPMIRDLSRYYLFQWKHQFLSVYIAWQRSYIWEISAPGNLSNGKQLGEGHFNKNLERFIRPYRVQDGAVLHRCLMCCIQEYARDINYHLQSYFADRTRQGVGRLRDQLASYSRCFALRPSFLASISKYSSF